MRIQMLAGGGLVVAVTLAALSGCAKPVGAGEFQTYTGIGLCPTAVVRDLTSDAERNEQTGNYFHVDLAMDADCRAAFQRQLAAIDPGQCAATQIPLYGCKIADASVHHKTRRHTAIAVTPLQNGRYDVLFSETLID